MRRPSNAKTCKAALKTAACVAAVLAAGGCQEYFDRSDTITLGVADATETNKAVQTITRWPKASREDRWLTDGERSRSAIARYRANKVTPPRTLSGKVSAGVADSAPVADTPVLGASPKE